MFKIHFVKKLKHLFFRLLKDLSILFSEFFNNHLICLPSFTVHGVFSYFIFSEISQQLCEVAKESISEVAEDPALASRQPKHCWNHTTEPLHDYYFWVQASPLRLWHWAGDNSPGAMINVALGSWVSSAPSWPKQILYLHGLNVHFSPPPPINKLQS